MLPSNSAKEDSRDWHLKINDLQRGIRVLARKKTDGHFYRGHIVQHVEVSLFTGSKSGRTSVFDIGHLSLIHVHCVSLDNFLGSCKDVINFRLFSSCVSYSGTQARSSPVVYLIHYPGFTSQAYIPKTSMTGLVNMTLLWKVNIFVGAMISRLVKIWPFANTGKDQGTAADPSHILSAKPTSKWRRGEECEPFWVPSGEISGLQMK